MKVVIILFLAFTVAVATGGNWLARLKLNQCKDPVHCLVDPCKVSTCPAIPKAKCISDFCGGCNARFFLEVTDQCNICVNIGPATNVKCDATKQCPGTAICDQDSNVCCCGETQFACLVPPCDSATCPNHPNARCVNEFCNGCCCEARFFLDKSNVEVTNECTNAIN